MKLDQLFESIKPEIVEEGAKRAFKRVGTDIKRYFRCTSGQKAGKLVSDPKLCAVRKNRKRVRVGKIVARTRAGVRINKTKIRKKTAASKLVTRLNKTVK